MFPFYFQEQLLNTDVSTFFSVSRCKEVEAKLEVAMRSKQATETTISEKVNHLEKALEEVIA